jgi:hypothetical protein
MPGQTVFFRDLGLAPGPILEEAFSRAEWLPLWTNGLGEGRPLLANPGNSLLAPLSLLYRLLPFELAFELFLLLHLVVAALGMRALARGLGGSEAAAWTAGAAFGLGGFLISSTSLVPTLAAAAFAPWVALAALRAVEAPGPRRIACLALALAAAALGGQPEPLILTIAATSLWCLVVTTGHWKARVARSLLAWGIGGVWALMIAAPQVLVAALHARTSLRSFGFTAEGLLYNSLHPERLPAFFLPRWGGHPFERLEGGFAHAALEDSGSPYFPSLYLGLGVVLLATAAFLRRTPDSGLKRLRAALALTAVAGLLLALGRHLPGLAALVDAMPALLPFRFPVKFAFLVHLALPLLAAAGLDGLRARWPATQRRWTVVGLPLLVALDLLLSHASMLPTVEKDEGWPRTALAVEVARVCAAPDGPGRLYVHRLPQAWAHALPANRRSEAELYRRQRRLLLPAMGLPQGIDYAFDPSFDLLDPISEFELVRAAHAEPGARQWRALGEAAGLLVLSPQPDLADGSGGELQLLAPVDERFGVASGEAWLYRNLAYKPRVRMEGIASVQPGAGVAELMELLEAEPPAPGVLLDAAPTPEPSGSPLSDEASGATIQAEDHRSLVVRAHSPVPALLVVADTLTAGWSATVDGEPAPLLRASAAFRAVALPAGEHLVEMRYSPPGLVIGTWLALIGLTAVVVAFLRRRPS